MPVRNRKCKIVKVSYPLRGVLLPICDGMDLQKEIFHFCDLDDSLIGRRLLCKQWSLT